MTQHKEIKEYLKVLGKCVHQVYFYFISGIEELKKYPPPFPAVLSYMYFHYFKFHVFTLWSSGECRCYKNVYWWYTYNTTVTDQ